MGVRVGYAIHVIIVTHNSEEVLPHCLSSLRRQPLPPASCIVVDSGSDSPAKHEKICQQSGVVTAFLPEPNRGFAAANNAGFALLENKLVEGDIVLFLNPDCFVKENTLAQICRGFFENPGAGAIGGTLLGYDLARQAESGLLDSTGIFRRWYGRWYDRDQGKDVSISRQRAQVPALCGALLACRYTVLSQIAQDGEIFDSDFFLYKEDIELSLRLVQYGWQLWYLPGIEACHCRGWAQKRGDMPYTLRLLAAENEIRLYRKHPSPYILWALLKYLLVRFLRV